MGAKEELEKREKEGGTLQNRSRGKKLIKLEDKDGGVQGCNLSPHHCWL